MQRLKDQRVKWRIQVPEIRRVTVDALIDLRRAEVDDLCRQLRVCSLDVFGSAAQGRFDPSSSDVDLVVEFEPMPPAEYAEAYFSLKEGLESLFGRPVDLLSASSIRNPYFRESVDASKVRIYAA
jgi:predicted nucleotidyltransferase